jgi:hypothetical protein
VGRPRKKERTPHQNEGGPVETMVKVKEEGEGEEPPGSPSSPSIIIIIIIIIFFR